MPFLNFFVLILLALLFAIGKWGDGDSLLDGGNKCRGRATYRRPNKCRLPRKQRKADHKRNR